MNWGKVACKVQLYWTGEMAKGTWLKVEWCNKYMHIYVFVNDEQLQSQIEQFQNHFFPSWINEMCLVKLDFCENL